MLNKPENIRVADKLALNMDKDKYFAKIQIGSVDSSRKFFNKYRKTRWGDHHGKIVVVLAIQRIRMNEGDHRLFIVRFEKDPKDTNFVAYPYYLEYPKRKSW